MPATGLRSTATVTMPSRFSASGASLIDVSSASFTGAVTVAGLARGRGRRRLVAAGGDRGERARGDQPAESQLASYSPFCPLAAHGRPTARSTRADRAGQSASTSRARSRASVSRRVISSTKRYDTSPAPKARSAVADLLFERRDHRPLPRGQRAARLREPASALRSARSHALPRGDVGEAGALHLALPRGRGCPGCDRTAGGRGRSRAPSRSLPSPRRWRRARRSRR